MNYITIEGFEQLTAQQMFDMSLAHLRRTGVKSKNEFSCMYGGTGCAAAPFLRPDKRDFADQQSDMEGVSWVELVDRGFVPNTHFVLIAALQRAHDRAPRFDDELGLAFPQLIELRFKDIAKRFDLDYTPLV